MKKPGELTAMISSTALDLPEHRKEALEACLCVGVFPIGMDYLPARDASGIQVSLEMVDQADIYIGIYAWRYGWMPDFDNPGKISITEMEFNRALERKQSGHLKEILIFVMHEDHLILQRHKEDGAKAQRKLKKFKERASSGRVRHEFKSSEELRGQIIQALSDFKHRHPKSPSIPQPPAFYAEPDYIVSNRFIGRQSQLQELSDWARPADPNTMLLFEAIGGNGKSMLTWEWTNHHATKVRSDWAGRFWYSFYEKGAVMADFCQRALAYMTGQPLEELRKKKTTELARELLAQLHAHHWLLILDGLERVLVAYHRIDAAEVPDEEANLPTDKIVSRDPCSAIRDEDDDLLRSLAAAAPSKVLVSSRLTPRVLLNKANQPIPGVRRISLPGLRPPDAEELLRTFGINGNSEAIQSYLTANCDCHPLVIGVLAGLINDYLPDKGNFDAWAADPCGGGQLNLASLDLIQRRNHILRASLAALPDKSGQLLSTLALLPESIDYPTLCALNPHMPPEPEELAKTVRDLERRNLLQYDGRTKRYDLHPVVRGVAAGGLKPEEKEQYGQRVVDHFSQQSHNPYEQAETLEDVRNGLNLVRALIKMGHFQEAYDAFKSDLGDALFFNLEAYTEILMLLRPFFPAGWGKLPNFLEKFEGSRLANDAASALSECGELKDATTAYGACICADLETEIWVGLFARLCNISALLDCQNLFARARRILSFAFDLAILEDYEEGNFMSRLFLFSNHSIIGQWADAEAIWQLLDPMGRDWSRVVYRPGTAENRYAKFQFWKGTMQEDHLLVAERLAKQGKNRGAIRDLHWLRGVWRLEQGEWALAAASLKESVRMAREREIRDAEAETGLALAKFHLGELAEPQTETEQLAQARNPAHRLLAVLWLALGNHEQAKKHALAAYQEAWGQGEPYVFRYELIKTTELLQQLGVPIPNLPPYDPSKDEKFPWEDAVAAAIEKLRAEKQASKDKPS